MVFLPTKFVVSQNKLKQKIITRLQGCQSLLRIWGDHLQFYPNFALFSTFGGMNLNHDFVQVRKLIEDPKKRSSPKMEHFFSPNPGEDQKKRSSPKEEHLFPQIRVNTYALMHTSVKLLGGCRYRPYSNCWGGYSQIIGGIHPPGFGTPARLRVAKKKRQSFFKNW